MFDSKFYGHIWEGVGVDRYGWVNNERETESTKQINKS